MSTMLTRLSGRMRRARHSSPQQDKPDADADASTSAAAAQVYMEDVEFLSQLLEYMDMQQAKVRAEGRHDWSTAPLIILSTVVAAQAQVYLADFFQRAGGEGLYAAAAAEARSEPPPLGQLVGQLYHALRGVSRLELVGGVQKRIIGAPLPPADLTTFPALQCLYLERVELSQLRGLSSLRLQLRLLSVQHCAVLGSLAPLLLLSDADGPEAHDNSRQRQVVPYQWSMLEVLRVRSCGISFMDASLQQLNVVRHLDLSCNSIEHVQCLHQCTELQHLDLSHNLISSLVDVTCVIGNITVLLLGHNRVESTEGLDRLFSLQVLDLGHNLLVDFEEVSRLGSLPCLRQITLQGNPLARRSKYRVTVLAMLGESYGPTSSWLFGGSTRDAGGGVVLDGHGPTLYERHALKKLRFAPSQVRLAPMASTPASSTATSTANQPSLGGSTFGTPATVISDTTFDETALPALPAAPRWTARRPAKPAQIEDMAPCSGSALAYSSALGSSVLAEHEEYEPLQQAPQLSGLDLQQQQQQQEEQLQHSTSADSESDLEVEAVLWSLRHRSSSGAEVKQQQQHHHEGVDLDSDDSDSPSEVEALLWSMRHQRSSSSTGEPHQEQPTQQQQQQVRAEDESLSHSQPVLQSQQRAAVPDVAAGESDCGSSTEDEGETSIDTGLRGHRKRHRAASSTSSSSRSSSSSSISNNDARSFGYAAVSRASPATSRDHMSPSSRSCCSSMSRSSTVTTDVSAINMVTPLRAVGGTCGDQQVQNDNPWGAATTPPTAAQQVPSRPQSPLPLPARPYKAASSGLAPQHYYGSPAYAGLLVLDHLQLYFKEHVFGSHAGAPYLHTMYHGPPAASASAAADAAQPEPESFIALFRDTIVPGAASGKAAHMREVLTRPALRRDANGAPRGNAAGEVPVLVVITSHRVHFVTEDGLAEQTFAEAPRPTSLVSVLLRDLREAALGLALQKLRLVFEHVFDVAADTGGSGHHHHSESGSVSPFTLEVTVLTRSRSRTHALITALEPAAADARVRAGLPALAVTNEDAPAMEALAPLTGGRESALALYQLVLQRWPLRPWVAAPRSLLATASELVLCDESHDSSASDLQPFVVDRGRLADVTSVELLSRRGSGCLQFSVKLRAQGVLQSKRQWVLQCRTSSDADRVVAELRRLSKAQRDGKGVVATALRDLLL